MDTRFRELAIGEVFPVRKEPRTLDFRANPPSRVLFPLCMLFPLCNKFLLLAIGDMLFVARRLLPTVPLFKLGLFGVGVRMLEPTELSFPPSASPIPSRAVPKASKSSPLLLLTGTGLLLIVLFEPVACLLSCNLSSPKFISVSADFIILFSHSRRQHPTSPNSAKYPSCITTILEALILLLLLVMMILLLLL
tara:strand:- start:525 stop:1103 length:579 start_codon:yes stop_codon:yes gene_type:complete